MTASKHIYTTYRKYNIFQFKEVMYKIANKNLTLNVDKVSIVPKSTQWAALRTQSGATSVPPQKCCPLTCNDTIHGYS
jgi:hypothetical protein